MRPLGKRQRAVLARLGGLRHAMVVGGAVEASLVRRGLCAAEPDGGFVRITAAGLRALADEIDAGREQPFSVADMRPRAFT